MKDLKKIIDNPLIDAKMTFEFSLNLNLPFETKIEVLDLRLSGFRDEDGDFKPEFDVALSAGGMEIIADQEIELDPAKLFGALGNGMGGVGDLFTNVFEGLKAKNIKLPWA